MKGNNMVVLSFSVYKDKVMDGSKTRTMRAVLKDGHVNQKWYSVYKKWGIVQAWLNQSPHWNGKRTYVWDYHNTTGQKYRLYIENPLKLHIYWKARSPQHEKLFDAVLTNITKKRLGELTEDEWIADGFKADIWNPNIETACQTQMEPREMTSAAINGLNWFSNTYNLGFDWENTGPSPELLNFEVYIIEFARVK